MQLTSPHFCQLPRPEALDAGATTASAARRPSEGDLSAAGEFEKDHRPGRLARFKYGAPILLGNFAIRLTTQKSQQ
jgi:hypothetical protein